MTETSSLTFSAGRVETNSQAGSRGRFGGDVLELAGLARAKQTFLLPGLQPRGVSEPQVSAAWPARVSPPAPAVAPMRHRRRRHSLQRSPARPVRSDTRRSSDGTLI